MPKFFNVFVSNPQWCRHCAEDLMKSRNFFSFISQQHLKAWANNYSIKKMTFLLQKLFYKIKSMMLCLEFADQWKYFTVFTLIKFEKETILWAEFVVKWSRKYLYQNQGGLFLRLWLSGSSQNHIYCYWSD